MTEQFNEVRLNHNFSTFSIAEYDRGDNSESKPIINQRVMRTKKLLEKLQMSSNFPILLKDSTSLAISLSTMIVLYAGGSSMTITCPPSCCS